jgi:glucose/arabinose dehydrogenase
MKNHYDTLGAMKWMLSPIVIFLALSLALLFALRAKQNAPPDIPEATNTTNLPLTLPKGFSISVFAKNLGDPRVMISDPAGNLLVSIPSEGKVLALQGNNGDGNAGKAVALVSGLHHPHGLAFRCSDNGVDVAPTCTLYIAETNEIAAYGYDWNNFILTKQEKVIDLPDGGNHVTRTIMFMPYPNQNKLLVSIGSSCNVCNEKNDARAKILVYDIVTKKLETFAKGLRNSVFMAIQPGDDSIWATEMGRDLLGDNIPPDEINIMSNPLPESWQNFTPQNFGWPICYGKNIHDTAFDHNTYIRNPCMEPFETPSYIDIPAHSAPLGFAFIPKDPPARGWPQAYWYNLLVAYHGSWNRTIPTGYKIVRYKLDAQGKVLGPPEDFITGWLKENNGSYEALGRPADILIQSGGTMYISDDKAGVIYRVTYNKSQ